MKQKDVQIGATYLCKVGANLVEIKIMRESPHGGWEAKSLKTNKKIRVKSPQRLRRLIKAAPGRKTTTAELRARAAADQENARVRDERAQAPDGMTASEHAMAASEGGARDPKEPAKPKRKGALTAAAELLCRTEQELGCSAMVNMLLAEGSWHTTGKTPANTLHAAISREIKQKGSEARFVVVGRGKFAASPAAQAAYASQVGA